MKLSKEDQGRFRAIIERLSSMAMYAADPHVDCRDEMATMVDQVDGLVDELLADDEGDADTPAVAGPHVEEGGAA